MFAQSAFCYVINEFEAYYKAYHLHVTTRYMGCDL